MPSIISSTIMIEIQLEFTYKFWDFTLISQISANYPYIKLHNNEFLPKSHYFLAHTGPMLNQKLWYHSVTYLAFKMRPVNTKKDEIKTLIPILNAKTMHNMPYNPMQLSIKIKNMNAINWKYAQKQLNIDANVSFTHSRKQ